MNNRYKKYILPFLNFAVLDPKGIIAHEERSLMITAVLLMLIIVIPVFIITAVFAWKYRANGKAKHSPNWTLNLKSELVMWAIPTIIVLALWAVTWKGTHELDPFKALASEAKPITIQVVALQWKWLFIYPEQNIATVNFVQFPKSTPINFQITADAPMNSFWIPQLGGQMYAMPGMDTQLHLMADASGEFNGSTAELSGAGFASMRFIAKSTTDSDFESWVQSVKKSQSSLTLAEYNKLAVPTSNNPPAYFSSTDKNLYQNVIMKFMMP